MKYLDILILSVSLVFFTYNKNYSSPINQYINKVSPSMNENSALKSSNIVVSFAQTMDGSTMTNDNIKVFGYQTGLLNVSVEYNPLTNILTVNPINDFKNGEIIGITLTSGIKTIINESMPPFVFTFRVKALGGTGSFILSSEINNTENGYIRSGDIDRDGDIDLVINNSIFKNNGNAIFETSSTLSNEGRPDLFDADNDGDLDIFISNNSTIYFYKNDGLGNFSLFSTFNGSVWAYGDLSGNGFLDITYFVNTSEVKTSLNLNGIFSVGQTISLTGQCVNGGDLYDNLIINDFNNDGTQDIMAISGRVSGNSITFYDICRNYNYLMNNGAGVFSAQNVFYHFSQRWPPIIFSVRNSKSFDNNGDGFVDVASPILQLNNNGNGSFSDAGEFFAFSNSNDFDLNGDGSIDLCVNSFGSPLFSYINNGSGIFSFYSGNNQQFSSGSASGDFDNDGDIDIAIKEYSNDKVAILLNGDTPLPVELSSFTSETEANNVILNWSTSSEENNAGYDIERSIFNVQSSMFNDNWSKVGFVTGGGTTNSMNNYTFKDKNLQSGKYKYRLKQSDFYGNFKYYDLTNEVMIGVPDKFYLSQNYPNPFNPATKLGFGISESGYVSLKIYDILGNEVAVLINESKAPGYYYLQFDGSKLPSGVYYYRLESKGFTLTKRMMLLK